MITFSSIYGFNSREPMVHFRWGNESGELTLTEARAHAIAVLEVVAAATMDAFLFEFAAKIDPANTEKAGAVLMQEFRDWRQERGFGGGIDPTDHRPNRAERRRKK